MKPLRIVGLFIALLLIATTGAGMATSATADSTVVEQVLKLQAAKPHDDSMSHAHEQHLLRNPSPEPTRFVPGTVIKPQTTSRTNGRAAPDPFVSSSSVIGPRFARIVHMMELPDSNRMLACAGSGNSFRWAAARRFECDDYNWDTGQKIDISPRGVDLFCMAAIFMADGRLLMSGGTGPRGYPQLNRAKRWMGERATFAYNPWTKKLDRLGDMNEPRWYNNQLRNWFTEAIYTFGGQHNKRFSTKWEQMLPGTTSWRYLPWSQPNFSYDDHKMLDATHAVFTGATSTNSGLRPYIQNIQTGARTPVTGLRAMGQRNAAAPITLYPAQRKQVAIFGGGAIKGPSTNLVDILDLSVWPNATPKYRPAASMPTNAIFVLASNLPNGQVFVTGGDRYWRTGSVKWAALYTPWTNSWTRLNPSKVARSYHGTIYTRADGRVVTFGGNPKKGKFESRSEIFTLWYHNRPAPVIGTYTKQMTRGSSYDVAVTFPVGTSYGRVTLDSPRSMTHSASDTGFGLYDLPATRTDTGVRVTVPAGAVIPTGWYKLNVVTGGEVTSSGPSGLVPSRKSVWVKIS